MNLTFTGDFKVGKEQMKLYRAEAMKEINKIERKPKLSLKDSSRLNRLEKQIYFYSVSKILPVRVGEIVINGKLLQSFIKKLGSKYAFSIKLDEFKLTLEYQNKFSSGKGCLSLLDISDKFKNFPDIPKLEIPEGVLYEKT